jgi:hypothetical protein
MKPREDESYKRGYSGFSVKKGFTTEARSSQRSEIFSTKSSLLRVLGASAVQPPSPGFTGKFEEP